MATAQTTRRNASDARWAEEVVSDNPPPKWDFYQSYLVTAINPEYKGKSAGHEFNNGKAQIEALEADASDEAIGKRIAELDWLKNAGYTIKRARFLQAVVEEEDDE